MNLMTDIVNGKLIATGKGGGKPGMPWATLVFSIETDELLDIKWYSSEERARLGHWESISGGN